MKPPFSKAELFKMNCAISVDTYISEHDFPAARRGGDLDATCRLTRFLFACRKGGRHAHLPPLLLFLFPVFERPFAVDGRRCGAPVVIGLGRIRYRLFRRRLLFSHRDHSKRSYRWGRPPGHWMINWPIIPACC